MDPHHFNVESDLIESLLNQDSSIISSPKIDSLLEEFSGELAHIDSIPPGIDETDFDHEEEIRLVKKLLIVTLMEEIDLFLTPDDAMPPGIENDDYDIEGDILFLKELLRNDSPSLPDNESFHPLSKVKGGFATVIRVVGGPFESIENDDYDIEGDILFLKELLRNDSPSLPNNESFHPLSKVKGGFATVIRVIDSLLDKFAGELTLLKSILPRIDETDYHPRNEIRLSQRLLYDNSSPRPPKEFVFENSNADVESFSPFPIRIEDNSSIISSPKIDSLLEEFSGELAHIDSIPPEIDETDFDHEEEIRLVKKLLYDNSSPRPPKEPSSENSDAIIESFSPSPIPVEDSDSYGGDRFISYSG
nr:hypothetical protein [Tanacetum cinerariifolium]